MNKLFFSLLFVLFPGLVFADNSISFAPPTTDYSVGFLANIFGVVDGVLHGTGSQIMGAIFSVFNAAVMALGGIIVTYTMIISTMNTAHEGEMLGKKWNSIWVPVRATAGFALLIPKASGYCLLQIFVMWVVVQGVGAADKVWNAALSYLNRGGVIIQAQVNPTQELTGSTGYQKVTQGAMVILSGQVCMQALQKILENTRTSYLDQKNKGLGPCTDPTNPDIKSFCETSVPDFAGSVDINGAQSAAAAATQAALLTANANPETNSAAYTNVVNSLPKVTVLMPNFSSNDVYVKLNGICGVISWSQLVPNVTQATALAQQASSTGLTAQEISAMQNARAIGIQQIYSDLLTVAQVIVDNDPQISQNNASSSGSTSESSIQSLVQPATSASADTMSQPAYPWATEAFGVPLTVLGEPCANNQTPNCVSWGTPSSATTSSGALLNGTELVGSVLDYVGVMQPTVTLMNQANTQTNNASGKDFIQTAETQGWIMAGSYFFNLVLLNQTAMGQGGVDDDPGLEKSQFELSTVNSGFSTGSESTSCQGTPTTAPWTPVGSTPQYPVLCELLGKNVSAIQPLNQLINGNTTPVNNIPTNMVTNNPIPAATGAAPSSPPSTVFGYLQNALVIKMPGQQGQKPLTFANFVFQPISVTQMSLPSINNPCHGVAFVGCMIQKGVDAFMSVLWSFMGWFFSALLIAINELLNAMLNLPLTGFALIFTHGVAILSLPGINPIVALAQMGTYYINFVGTLLTVILALIAVAVVTPIGPLVAIMAAFVMPIVVSWSLIMLGIGFITAYYIPLIPYMIFTFGGIAWFMAVIEAMVAAPIVALGVIHPEGSDQFGKAEPAIMILMNVFLRPSMMIIGYISAISLSYVGVWLLNAGFDQAIGFMQESPSLAPITQSPLVGPVPGGYTSWAYTFGFFFSVLIYTTIYMTIVEKAFTLISELPDKVLRWIGGTPEGYGEKSAQWVEQTKGKVEKGADASEKAIGQMQKSATGGAVDTLTPSGQGSAGAEGGDQGGGGGGGAGGGAGAAGGGGAAPSPVV